MNLVALLLAAASLLPPRYAPGERTTYSIVFMGMRMGVATISVGEPSAQGVPVRLEAHTTGLAGAVQSLREELSSLLEPETGLPISAAIDKKEGSWKHYDTTDFDRAAGEATLVERGKRVLTKKFAIPKDALEFVSLLFQLRRMPLEPGDRRTFPVVAGDKVHDVIVEVMERETLDTKAGTFPTLKIRIPTGFTGKFSQKNPTYVWLSDDDRRVVVQMTMDLSLGSGRAELVSYEPGRPPAPPPEPDPTRSANGGG
jgi:hypothetical protein